MQTLETPYYQTCFELFETFEAAWKKEQSMSSKSFWQVMSPFYKKVARSNRLISAKLDELFEATLLLEAICLSQQALDDKKSAVILLQLFQANKSVLPPTLFKRQVDNASTSLKELYQLFRGAQVFANSQPLFSLHFDEQIPLSFETPEKLIKLIETPLNEAAVRGWENLTQVLWQIRGTITGLQRVVQERIQAKLPPNPCDN